MLPRNHRFKRKLIVNPDPAMPGTMLVPMTQGVFSIVDAADAEHVGTANWVLFVGRNGTRYAQTATPGQRGKKELLHRFLWKHWGMADTPQLDHVNTDSLDCRRENLRAADKFGNAQNKGLMRTNTSGFKGVVFHKPTRRWTARIDAFRKQHYIGIYDSPEEAAEAYAKAARELHGEFARTA